MPSNKRAKLTSKIQIGKTSGLVLTLTGILKAILLVAISVVIWRTPISMLQALGYGIALLGSPTYSLGYDNIVKIFSNLSAAANSYGAVPGSPNGVRGGLLTKRYVVLGTAVIGFLFVIALLFSWVSSVPTITTSPLGTN